METGYQSTRVTEVTLGLASRFCQCGMIFYVPEWLSPPIYCPKCAERLISTLNAQILGQKKVIDSLAVRLDRARKEVKQYAHDLESGS